MYPFMSYTQMKFSLMMTCVGRNTLQQAYTLSCVDGSLHNYM